MEQAAKFIETLYQHCDEGYIEFRYLPSGKQEFVVKSDFKLPSFPKEQDIHFGVATRDGKGGTKNNILQFPCLWVDIDFKDIPEDEANERLRHSPLQPTITVMSGNGYHIYYMFKEPVGKVDIPLIVKTNKKLAHYFNGDLQSAEAAHILRVPGTLNLKYAPPRRVELANCDGSLTYEFDDFDQHLPEVAEPNSIPSSEMSGETLSFPTGLLVVDKFGCKIPEGYRDNYLFHVGHQLAKSNTPQNIIRHVSHLLGQEGCNPPLPDKQIEDKVKSALKRAKEKTLGLRGAVREWIDTASGIFETKYLYSDLNITDGGQKKQIRNYLYELCEEGVITKHGRKTGVFRKRDTERLELDLTKEDEGEISLWLPFGLHEMVTIRPNSIVLIVGNVNAGKTATLLNISYQNKHRFDIHFLSSELTRPKAKARIRLFKNWPIPDPKFHFYERGGDFEDWIEPRKDALNVIDYLKVLKDFFEIGERLEKIYQSLQGSIAIIAVQNNPRTDLPFGGQLGLFVPDLVVSMGRDRTGDFKVKILKAKEPKTKYQLDGFERIYRIENGTKIISPSNWNLE
jgi:hypothetical protein